MVGEDEDDEVEQKVVVKDKGSKQGPSHYVCTSDGPCKHNKLKNKFSPRP